MIALFLFCLGTIGLANILVHGEILDLIYVRPILKWIMGKKWFALFECYECTGWWSGLFMGWLLLSSGWQDWGTFIPCAFAGAVLGDVYRLLNNYIQSKMEYVIENDTTDTNES